MSQEPPPAPPADESKSAALWRAAFALRELIFSRRGQIISTASEIEGMVDGVICTFFVSTDLIALFRIYVLARIQLSGKLDVLSDMTKLIGLSNEVQDGLRRLRRVSDLRNELAHSSVTFNPNVHIISAATLEEFTQFHSWKVSRRGVSMARIEADQLARQVRFVEAAQVEALRIHVAFIDRRAGTDPRAALATFDAANAAALREIEALEGSIWPDKGKSRTP